MLPFNKQSLLLSLINYIIKCRCIICDICCVLRVKNVKKKCDIRRPGELQILGYELIV